MKLDLVYYIGQIVLKGNRTKIYLFKLFDFFSLKNRFISEYGLYFTKEDHINIINIYLDVLLTPSLDLPLVEHFSNILIELLKYLNLIFSSEQVIGFFLLIKKMGSIITKRICY